MSTTISLPNEAQEKRVASRRGMPTWEIAYLYPRQGDWTEEEYLGLETNLPVELSDGCLEFLPMPTPLHQLVVQFLYRLLDDFVESRRLGKAFIAPLPVRLWSGKYREPDVMFIRPGRLQDLRRPPDGADLVMEVVSPGDEARERDLETKRDEYARAGISEYWIVDPEQRRITVLTLDEQQYRVHGEFGSGQTATSVLLDGFAVSVDPTFAAEESLESPKE